MKGKHTGSDVNDRMCFGDTAARLMLQELRYAVPLLRRLVAGLSPRSSGLDLTLVHVGFVLDKVAL